MWLVMVVVMVPYAEVLKLRNMNGLSADIDFKMKIQIDAIQHLNAAAVDSTCR